MADENNNMQKSPLWLCSADQVKSLPVTMQPTLTPTHNPPPSPLSLLHPRPNINIHGATGVWRAEYIEPATRCGDGGRGGGWEDGAPTPPTPPPRLIRAGGRKRRGGVGCGSEGCLVWDCGKGQQPRCCVFGHISQLLL